MSNFIGMVFATLKNEGIDTSGMSTDEAVKKYNELQVKSGGKAGADQPTPAENKKMRKDDIQKYQEYRKSLSPEELEKQSKDPDSKLSKLGNKADAQVGKIKATEDVDDKRKYDKKTEENIKLSSDVDDYASHYGYNGKEPHDYIDKRLKEGATYKKAVEEAKEIMANGEEFNRYKKIESMTTKEMKKEMAQHEKYLLKTYNEKQLKEFKNKYNEAKDILLVGGEVEDKKGLEYAQKHFYDEAEEIMRSLPKEYTRFRELDDELW